MPHRFLTSGNAHAEPPSWLQSARRKIGAGDDDTQPAAKEGCGRLPPAPQVASWCLTSKARSGAGWFLRACLRRFRRRGRWTRGALNRYQAPAREAINPRPRPAKIGERHSTLAALIGTDIDLFNRAGAPHHVALRHLQRDAAGDEPARRGRIGRGLPISTI